MDNYKCDLCGGNEFKEFLRVRQTSLLRCRKCGLVFQPTRKLNRKEYYEKGDYERWKLAKGTIESTIEAITHVAKKGKMLEIGCAWGDVLRKAAKLGFETWGVENSEKCLNFIKKESNIRIIGTSFEKASLPKKYFDVVCLFHVLEHLSSPSNALKKLKSLINKSGIVIIEVPNIACFPVRWQREKALVYQPDKHLYYFTPKTLKQMITKYGFKVIKVERRYTSWDEPLSLKKLIKIILAHLGFDSVIRVWTSNPGI